MHTQPHVIVNGLAQSCAWVSLGNVVSHIAVEITIQDDDIMNIMIHDEMCLS